MLVNRSKRTHQTNKRRSGLTTTSAPAVTAISSPAVAGCVQNPATEKSSVNGAAEPRRLPLQVPRPPAAGRGDGLAGRGGRFEMPSGVVEAGELPVPALTSPVLRWLLVFMMGERHFSTGYIKLIATGEAPLEDEDKPPAPTALSGRAASCKQLPHP